ncbi:EAL domain-containing response regulator [Achromobacter sp. SD115]|uniref:EAL domain-containing response regulator n=1 Tax=Achromobacter sp. SD115 TaxID=2782011 RepID=UPI001A97B216|nr:EAL domain-containing response regulator [Achromobacter sp. SD115]MBO1016342.1 EAL domain-containing response regulator [Achromobacter sp. SD115]
MLSKLKVLVLDDHAYQCVLLKDMLEETGFVHVDTTLDAHDALERIRKEGHQLVLMDVDMPGMDGAQFIHELACRDLNPILAIVTGCSRRMSNSIGLMAKERGFAVLGSFIKPVTTEQIGSLATGLLRKPPTQPLGLPPARPHACATPARPLLDRRMLESALRDGSIHAWFQPKKSLVSGNIVGAEALVRWQHKELGLMLPSSFLASLRACDLDHELLLRMLDDGLKAYSLWRELGHRIPISVNLSASLLDLPQLPDELHAMVARLDVPASDVTFELLEDAMPTLAGQFHMGASRLRLKGFGLSQDDFGKGYSSMYSLISTPFTELKIDRAFVNGAATDEVLAAALVASVQLGRQLGLQVTAEGVETLEDLQLLRRIGCDVAQGFLISAAVNVATFCELLAYEPSSYFTPLSPPH